MTNKITVGFATVLGTIGALAGIIAPFIGQLADATDPLGVPSSVWVVCGAVCATAVVLGRMGQAMMALRAGIPAIDDSDPESLIDEEPTTPTDVQGL